MNPPTTSDLRELRALMHLLINMSQNATRHGGNGITYPDEIAALARVLSYLESLPHA